MDHTAMEYAGRATITVTVGNKDQSFYADVNFTVSEDEHGKDPDGTEWMIGGDTRITIWGNYASFVDNAEFITVEFGGEARRFRAGDRMLGVIGLNRTGNSYILHPLD